MSKTSILADGLTDLKKRGKVKRTMKVRVHMSDDYDDGFNKAEYKRLKKEIEEVEKQLSAFDPEEAAERVNQALKSELAQLKAQRQLHKSRN